MKPRAFGRILGGLLLLLAVTARAEKVAAVRFENQGPGPLDEALMASFCSVHVGDELDRIAVAKDVRALLASGHLSDVRVGYARTADGVVLTYACRSKFKLVAPVGIVGATVLSERKVRDLLGLDPGDFVDDATVAARVVKVREEYHKKLYGLAKVAGRLDVTDKAKGLATVTVTIQEGARTVVQRLVFTGNTVVGPEELRTTLGWPAWYNPVGWFQHEAYDADDLRGGCDKIRGLYQDKGYLDVQVGEPQVHERAAGEFVVHVSVTEGRIYRVGQVAITGTTLFPLSVLRQQLHLRPGDLATGPALNEAREAVRDYYESRGYMNTFVAPALDLKTGQGTVDVTFQVAEGTLTTIQNVLIRGNAVTRDKVIRRELLVYPGEVYDGVRVRRSESRLRNLGYFSNVSSYPEETTTSNRNDLVFDVEEKSTGMIMVGSSFSSID